MAGPAGHDLLSAEVVAVDSIHHGYHLARRLLSWSIGFPLRIRCSGTHVAVAATNAERGRKESHRSHEFIDGDSLQHLDVFERLFGHLRPCSGRSLGASQ